MQSTTPRLFRNLNIVSLSILCFLSSATFAQEDFDQLNTVLDIDALYQPIVSQEIHGETAVNLLEVLQTKHLSLIHI